MVDLKNEIPAIQGTLDEAQAKWWESWRKRVKIESEARVGGSAASRRSKKKRKLDAAGAGAGAAVVKVEEEEKNVVTFDVSMDEEFGRPMAIDEIKLDEELMHEEMRILIKVSFFVLYLSTGVTLTDVLSGLFIVGHHRWFYEA